jgi:hypothetical protein
LSCPLSFNYKWSLLTVFLTSLALASPLKSFLSKAKRTFINFFTAHHNLRRERLQPEKLFSTWICLQYNKTAHVLTPVLHQYMAKVRQGRNGMLLIQDELPFLLPSSTKDREDRATYSADTTHPCSLISQCFRCMLNQLSMSMRASSAVFTANGSLELYLQAKPWDTLGKIFTMWSICTQGTKFMSALGA